MSAKNTNTKPAQQAKQDIIGDLLPWAAGFVIVGAIGNAILSSKPVDDFFKSFDRVSVPEPYCVLRTNAAGSHVEIFARSAEHNDNHRLDQASTNLYSTDGRDTPLKEGMTGTFASKAANNVYLYSKPVKDGPEIEKYTSPDEYASVTISSWTYMDGTSGPVGKCSKVSKNAKVGPVWEGMPIRNWLAGTSKAPQQGSLAPASL